MTNDIPANVATGSDPKEPTQTTKTAARTTRAAEEEATKSARNKTKTCTKTSTDAGTKAGTKATQEDPGEESSSSDTSSSSSAYEGVTDQSSSDHEEDPTFHHSFRTGADPFPPEWYQSKTRTYIEETLQVPGSHRHNYPRPFVIRDADFNRTLSSCSTGARKEAEVLYTATAFLGLQLNRSNDFLESHPKIAKAAREHLEENWTYTFGIHEYLLARLDIIEGLQGDFQAQAPCRDPKGPSPTTSAPGIHLRGDVSSLPPRRYPIQGVCGYLRRSGRQTTEVKTSRRNPSRRTPTLSRPAPAGCNGLLPIRARRCPRREEATSRPAPAGSDGL
jgi:hypothetical protein